MIGEVSRFDRSYYDEKPEVEITRELLEDLAQSGDESATIQLAIGKLNGDSELKIERNATEAVTLFENLVQDTGHVNAHYALGVAYSKGTGVEVNSTKAIDHLNYAADRGVPGAFNTLGFIHNRGIGEVPKNQTKANIYITKAAELGSTEAIANLGVLYLNGEGVEKDIDKATRYLRLASLGGHTVSAFYLGVLIYNGIGSYYDCDEAMELFTEVYQ